MNTNKAKTKKASAPEMRTVCPTCGQEKRLTGWEHLYNWETDSTDDLNQEYAMEDETELAAQQQQHSPMLDAHKLLELRERDSREYATLRNHADKLAKALRFAIAQLDDLHPKGNKYRGLAFPAIHEGQKALAEYQNARHSPRRVNCESTAGGEAK